MSGSGLEIGLNLRRTETINWPWRAALKRGRRGRYEANP